ncbi:hypothetical protein ABW20_dc0109691 [Dactylellina cionopaga]|nr:hypothetical protein ABW20_dc0109691 [Dactylellina cionopaga]
MIIRHSSLRLPSLPRQFHSLAQSYSQAPVVRPSSQCSYKPARPYYQCHQQTRSFILPTPPAQRFSATRRISYPPSQLFTLISDVNSYSSFVPFCLSSTVTECTPPPDRLPVKADLRVGWGGVDETFTSRVKCEKKEIGSTSTGRGGGGGGMVEADATGNSIFEVLRARWIIDAANASTTTAAGVGKTEDTESKVDLEIEYKFANPLYAALSEAVMPSVAGKIIEAFEERAKKVLGN